MNKNPLHTTAHRKDRESYFWIYPLCERCEKIGKTVPSFILHHIDRDQTNRLWSNYEALCNNCHEVEHGRTSECGCDVNGMPLNDNKWR